MNPELTTQPAARRPHGVRWRIAWLWPLALALALALGVGDARAQSRKRNRNKGKPAPAAQKKADRAASDGKRAGKDEVKVFDFTGLDISGELRTPQLLYFLDRANEELERASLERRSFIPEMVRSIDEEAL